MKVLFCGDPHLKITRFDLAKQFLTWLNSTIAEQKPDLYVCLGDAFDTHSVVRSEILSEFRKHIDFILNLNIPVVYVLGNHDQFKPNDNTYHALQSFKGLHKDLYIIDRVQDLFEMTFVPYIHNPEEFPKQSLPICVAHQTFKGADYGDITTKDGVDATSIKGVELIISGHIHKRQRYNLGGTSVFYVGSPFSQSVSDINQIKGLSIIDSSTYEETFIESPFPKWKGIRYELSQVFSLKDLHDDLSMQLNDIDQFIVEITGPKAEITSYLNSKKYKTLIRGKNIRPKPIFTDKEKKQMRIEAVSMSSIISDYVDKVYSGAIDKDILKTKALEIYEKVNRPLV